jgi:hypothetical protein
MFTELREELVRNSSITSCFLYICEKELMKSEDDIKLIGTEKITEKRHKRKCKRLDTERKLRMRFTLVKWNVT